MWLGYGLGERKICGKFLQLFGKNMVDLVRFELTTSSMPWKQDQQHTNNNPIKTTTYKQTKWLGNGFLAGKWLGKGSGFGNSNSAHEGTEPFFFAFHRAASSRLCINDAKDRRSSASSWFIAQRTRASCAVGFLNIPNVPLRRLANPLCSLRSLSVTK